MKINTLTINGNTFEIADPAVEALSQTVSQLNETSTSTSAAVKQLQNDADAVWKNIDQLVEEQKNCVLTVQQTMTDEQKAQARKNLGALEADTDMDMQNRYAIHRVSYITLYVPGGQSNDPTIPAQLSISALPLFVKDDLPVGVVEFAEGENDGRCVLRNIYDGIWDTDAATVGQLNAAVGDIETALDSIIAIQESLIGGVAE